MHERTKVDADYKDIKAGDIETACARYSLGKQSMRRVAEDAGAVIRIGKRYLINLARVDKYLDSISE